MKQINIKLSNCKECPYCQYEEWLYGFICQKSNKFLYTKKSNNFNIPDFCELSNIE
jgi:hypothetical protein